MNTAKTEQQQLSSMLDKIAIAEGKSQTNIDGVEVFRASSPTARAPIVYLPRILIVGQGRKQAFLGGETYVYDPSNYLVLTVPLPAECETIACPLRAGGEEIRFL